MKRLLNKLVKAEEVVMPISDMTKHENDLLFNRKRDFLWKNALAILQRFGSIGCRTAYIVGSFVTDKEEPNDIDICIDITAIRDSDYEKYRDELFSLYGLQKIKDERKIHLCTFFTHEKELEFFRTNREGKGVGWIQIELI